MAGSKNSSADINPLNSLFVELCEELGQEDVQKIKDLLKGGQITKREHERLQTAAEIFHLLLEKGCIAEDDLSLLKGLMNQLRRPSLAKRISSFLGEEEPSGIDFGRKSTSPGLDEFVPSDNQKRWLAFGIQAEKLADMITGRLSDFFEIYDTYLKHKQVPENISATVRIAVESIEKWSYCDFQDWEETSYSQDMENLIHAFEALDENGTEKRLMSNLKDGKSKELVKFLKNMTPGLLTKLSNFLTKVSTTSEKNSRTSTDDTEAMKERLDSAHTLIRRWMTSVENSESNYDEVILTFIPRVLLIFPILMLFNVNFVVIILII
ncbi:uncharacterized protein [Ptychodera flava]|uniref:uncharacterized protein n=1 Tax=Ptychodera flava TaxID=63121 RepID=UPI00396A1D55